MERTNHVINLWNAGPHRARARGALPAMPLTGFTSESSSSGCDPRAALGEIFDVPFSGSAAVGASPHKSADPARGPAWGSGALPVVDSLVSEKYGLEE